MPNKASARKSLRKNVKRIARNTLAKAELHSLRVKLRKLLADKKANDAVEVARKIGKLLDKAQARGILKKNTVARTKSRVMHSLNAALKAAK